MEIEKPLINDYVLVWSILKLQYTNHMYFRSYTPLKLVIFLKSTLLITFSIVFSVSKQTFLSPNNGKSKKRFLMRNLLYVWRTSHKVIEFVHLS